LNILEFSLLVWLGAFAAGFLGALTGLGGGVVVVPLLTSMFGIDIRYAIGAFLVSVIATSLAAASTYIKQGFTLYLIRHGGETVDYRVFRGEPAIYCSPIGIVQAVLEGRRGMIQLGLLVLIAVPILRVLLSFVTFLHWKDFTYVGITGLVLTGLIDSFAGAYF